MERKYKSRTTSHQPRVKAGSALILVVVLTSLLAIVGVTFIMAARVNRMATSGISDSKDLDSAVETVIAKIAQELILDVPYKLAGIEYYDYPGDEDRWLACLEPYRDVNDYKWRQISDVYGKLGSNLELDIDVPIPEYQVPSAVDEDEPADADGDGVADSKWIELEDITSNKGKPIYAAIRVTDNGAMLNVNTAYEFDPGETDPNLINGSSQTQIDLFALAQRSPFNDIDDLDDERFGTEPHNLDDYIRDVVWRYNEPNGSYTPFDVSDELETRNRFTLNRPDVASRLENLWADAFKGTGLRTPVDAPGDLGKWKKEVYFDDPLDPNDPNDYSYRHIGTVYNMDRIINPYGGKMLNINEADETSIYNAISLALNDANFADANNVAAQTTVNLIDFHDSDSNVTTFTVNGTTWYYGFERPCIYISELVHAVYNPPGGPMSVPPVYHLAYAVELYKPYPLDDDPCNWRLKISDAVPGGPMPPTYDIHWSGNRQFYVMKNDPCSILPPVDPNAAFEDYDFTLEEGGSVELQRCIDDVNGIWITVDTREVPNGLVPDFVPGIDIYSTYQRDITLHKCVRRLWDSTIRDDEDLGRMNSYFDPNSHPIQAHPVDDDFTNIGEIGMVFRKNAYPQGTNPINRNDTEAGVRLNLKNAGLQKLFNYLTVFDPSKDNINNDGDGITSLNPDGWIDEDNLNQTPEWKIPGRININTAPWFVLRQLPWMQTDIARAIVAYRDKDSVSGGPNYSGRSGEPGFRNIAELMEVDEMAYYADDDVDLDDFPDLTESDGAKDDFEERDVIFARFSNLVTVRSDVFTAYILVRIGKDGPQKRVMAILDRSDVYPYGTGRLRVRVLYPTPDPR